MLLPSRMAVLNYVNKVDNVNVNEVMDNLKKDYGNEAQFNEKMYSEHLMALEANGLVQVDSYFLDKNENLIVQYKITDDGKDAVKKYVPSRFQ